MTGLVLAVDGGNSKTIALVADRRGEIVGVGRGGGSDMYFRASPADAVAEIAAASRAALAASGAHFADLDSAAFALAGADLAEDIDLLTGELSRSLDGFDRIGVVNDALGSVWAGHPDGVGVAASFGTHIAIGMRNAAGATWHSSNFLDFDSGAVGIGSDALRAVWRANLGVDVDTGFTPAMLRWAGVPDVPTLASRFLGRERPAGGAVGRLAGVVLDRADVGDPTAEAILARHADQFARFTQAAAASLDMGEQLDIVVSGGLLNHRSTVLMRSLRARLPDARLHRSTREPALGVVIYAVRTTYPDEPFDVATVDASAPPDAVFDTAP